MQFSAEGHLSFTRLCGQVASLWVGVGAKQPGGLIFQEESNLGYTKQPGCKKILELSKSSFQTKPTWGLG